MRSALIKMTIGISLAGIIALSIKSLSTLASPSKEMGVFVVQPSTSILRFEEIGHACGGAHGSWITGYTAYDGKPLSLRSSRYASASEASQELQTRLQSAIRVQEIGAKYSQQGQRAGQRVIAFFVVDDIEIASIIWTTPESIFEIDTESLDCALEFERTKVKSLFD